MNLQIGQEIEIFVERLGINGEGVGYAQGYTVFVDGGLPKETVRAQLYEKRKTFGRAKIVSRLIDSPHRVKPPCPLFGKCGGCQLMHLEYAEQLVAKRQRVVDALERIGKFKQIEVNPCEPSPSSLAYRNKIQLPCTSEKPLQLGLFARNSHDLIKIEQCYIHCPLGEKVFQQIQKILKNSDFEGIKHVLIKTAVHTNQVLVILVTRTDLPKLFLLAEQIMKSMPEIRGVVQNINPTDGNVILGGEYRTLAGQGYIEETLHGLHFKVSPASFFQVNPAQAENLYQKALEFCALNGEEKVLDAYCGVGTLSLFLAAKAKEVIGVECVKEAITDAKENAEKNGITNAEFFCALSEDFITTLNDVDVAVLNPPRKGCEGSFLEKLASLSPKRIIYVSCDPATLARDLAYLHSKGYQIDKVQPFDMFPQTTHVECLVSLYRK